MGPVKVTYEAVVSSVSDTSLSFSFPALPAGKYSLTVNIGGGKGNAVSGLGRLTSRMEVNTVTPAAGSTQGGQVITIAGAGFRYIM